MTVATISRRRFLELGAGAGFALAFRWNDGRAAPAPAARAPFAPNAFVAIDGNGTATLTIARSEMGQGVRTSLAMVLAEELDADWSRIRIEQADGHPRFGDQATVGDESIRTSWEPLRKAAAAARAMLVAAAARAWQVAPEEVTTESSRAVHAASGRALDYGQLAPLAAREDIPAAPVQKNRSAFRLIGRERAGVDLDRMTRGAVAYGIDVRRDGMVCATIVRSPTVGGSVVAFDATGARSVAGFIDAFAVDGKFMEIGDTKNGVAVVALDTWSCLQARAKLRIDWNPGPNAGVDDAEIGRRLETALSGRGVVYRSSGDVERARREAARTLKRRYRTPFLAHAPLEPLNCTVEILDGRCEIWAPLQDPQSVRLRVADELGLPPDAVVVHVTMIGGGFGRKSLADFALEAVRIARRVGKPVKLMWTREDDIRHGFFKSPSLQELEAGIDARGRVTFYRHHTAFSSIMPSLFDPKAAELASWELADGAKNPAFAYSHAIPNQSFEGTHVAMPLRTQWLRGVNTYFHSFAVNSFIAELAAEVGRDPIDLVLEWIGPPRIVQGATTSLPTDYWMDTGRVADTIRRVRQLSGWGTPLPEGRGRGFAFDRLSGTIVAMVAEVTMLDGGAFRIDRVYSVADCGQVVNPDGARAQLQGGVIWGISCALYSEINVVEGAVVQGNYTDYRIARCPDCPEIVVDLMNGDHAPTGLGEPSVPPVAPAIANAIAAAGGQRPYATPFRRAGG